MFHLLEGDCIITTIAVICSAITITMVTIIAIITTMRHDCFNLPVSLALAPVENHISTAFAPGIPQPSTLRGSTVTSNNYGNHRNHRNDNNRNKTSNGF